MEKETILLKKQRNINSEYCQLLPDDICEPCVCRDDHGLKKKYYCGYQNLQPKRDCVEFNLYGIKTNGVYKIHQTILKITQVFCDQTTDNGGWTLFQRADGSVNFFRDWDDYKGGFGRL